MKKNNNLIEKIKNIQSKRKSNWARDAKFRLENKKWLDYSAQIAVRALAMIEDKDNFKQTTLAESLKISPQQVSKILKGQQNLTLKTIGNLSDALGFELISFPSYKDSFIRLMPTAMSYPDQYRGSLLTQLKNSLENLQEEIAQSTTPVISINSRQIKEKLIS